MSDEFDQPSRLLKNHFGGHRSVGQLLESLGCARGFLFTARPGQCIVRVPGVRAERLSVRLSL